MLDCVSQSQDFLDLHNVGIHDDYLARALRILGNTRHGKPHEKPDEMTGYRGDLIEALEAKYYNYSSTTRLASSKTPAGPQSLDSSRCAACGTGGAALL